MSGYTTTPDESTSDPKDEMNNAADPDGTEEESFATGNSQAQKDRDDVNQQQQKAKDNAKKSGLTRHQLGKNKIIDEGDFLRIKENGKFNPQTRKKSFTPEQVRALLLEGITEKGWTHNITFMRGYKIDQELTQVAKSILQSDNVLHEAIRTKGFEVPSAGQVSSTLPQNPPAWAKSERQQKKYMKAFQDEQIKQGRESMKALKKAQKKVKDFGGDTEERAKLADKFTKAEKELADQLPSVTKNLRQAGTVSWEVSKGAAGWCTAKLSGMFGSSARPETPGAEGHTDPNANTRQETDAPGGPGGTGLS